MTHILSFDQLPEAVATLSKEIGEIKKILLSENKSEPSDESEKMLTVREAANFLSLTVPTIYSKVSKRELPVMKRGKRLYFSSQDLINYLKEGRRKSQKEIDQAAETYLSTNKKG